MRLATVRLQLQFFRRLLPWPARTGALLQPEVPALLHHGQELLRELLRALLRELLREQLQELRWVQLLLELLQRALLRELLPGKP